MLHTSPRFADLTPSQYATGLAWLDETGLLKGAAGVGSASQRVFERAVADAEWFPDADMLIREPAELPADAREIADGLRLDEQDAFQAIRAVWGLFDDTQRKAIGAAGEKALVGLLRATTAADVDHVAACADGYGYDVVVSGSGVIAHLEVKSTTRHGRLVVYLSRNEFETMLVDPQWHLVVLRLTGQHTIEAISTVSNDSLRKLVPLDHTAGGRWESARLTLHKGMLRGGIPALSGLVTDPTRGVLIAGGA
ncbi:protein NO VEIN domain-containing protein [Promicromonospora sp. NPDC060271]|uniref:protein NO VEIN domain-containing protein n=1 Tax=Promicromonospora sp. NPDC060271 TaxID=3347089 RepID=UPI00365EB255